MRFGVLTRYIARLLAGEGRPMLGRETYLEAEATRLRLVARRYGRDSLEYAMALEAALARLRARAFIEPVAPHKVDPRHGIG